MDTTRGSKSHGRSVVGSVLWPVPRTVVIPRAADELTTLKAYLDHYRETLELKCSGGLPHVCRNEAPHPRP